MSGRQSIPKRTLDLLEQGDNDVDLGKTREVILVFGGANADKSSLVKFLAGEGDDLISRGVWDPTENVWNYVIAEGLSRKVESSAFIPKLIIDEDANVAFYDFPEFRNGVSPEEEIAAVYFAEKVISRAESVKILFILNHTIIKDAAQLKAGPLINFVSRATNLIKNLNNLESSIGLVVTQVDGSSENDIRVAINNINELCKSTKSCTEHQTNFLDILLATPRGVSKIGTWSKPKQAGFLKDIDNYKDEKEILKTLIHKKIQCGVNADYYSHEVSIVSQMYVPSVAEEIVTQIGEQLIAIYREHEHNLQGLEDLKFLFVSANRAFIQNSVPRGVLTRTLQILDELQINVSSEKLTRVLNSEKYLSFLERNYDQSIRKGLTNLQTYLQNSQVWYQNLSNMLNTVLPSYDVQQHGSVKMRELKDEAMYLESTGDTIIAYYKDVLYSSNRFIKFIKTPKSAVHGLPVEFVVEGKKKELLWKVLEVLRESNEKPKCQNGKLSVKGRFIRTSDVNEAVKGCGSFKEVEVFAVQKIFVDEDVDLSGKVAQLALVAPTWEVIGDREIKLDGRAGEAWKSIEDNAAVLPGSDGKPGEPGKPGGPAGQFVGITNFCMDCDHLIVSLVGGKGGPGQDGGKGVKGKDGRKPYDPRQDGVYTSMEDRWEATKYLSNWEGRMGKPYCWYEYGTSMSGIYDDVCFVRGEAGQKGGKGGNGGKGGVGGVAGKKVFPSIGYGSPRFTMEEGPSGAAGKRGPPGKGGQHGQNYRYRHVRILFGARAGDYVKNSTLPFDGDQGKDGYNGDVKEMLKHRKMLVEVEETSPVNNYKAFLRSKLNKTLVPLQSQRLLVTLETDKKVTSTYNVMSLVQDLQNLESQIIDLQQNNVPIAPYYTSLRDRVYEYAQNLSKTNENDNDHKIVLSYLYSTILIKLRNINSKFNDGLVVDIEEHIKQTSKNIEKMKEKNEAVSRNENKQNYMEKIESKIKEADSLINDVIEPAIKKAIAETDDQIVVLINETLEFKETAQKQQDELILKQHKLQDQLVLRYLLGTVQVASQLLALAGPVGATVGAAIGGVTQVAQGLLLTDDDGNHNFKDIPEGAKKTYTAISEHFKKKKENFKNQLEDAKTTLDKLDVKVKNDKSIKEIKAGITNTQEELEKLMSQDDDIDAERLDKMYNMRNKLTKLIDEEQSKLSKSPSKTESLLKKLDVAGKAKIIMEAGKVGKTVYDEIMKSKKSINNLGESIKKASDSISQLEKHEKTIHETIKKTTDGLRKGVDDMRETASTKSHSALDVSKWQIQGNLWDISQKLKAMADGYKAQGRLLFLINEVERGMNAMIQIYDRIQEYQETAQLADYLSRTSMKGVSLESVKDDKLRAAVSYLDQNMHFNLVLKEYEKSINALKHSVFPLAGNYTRLPREAFAFEFDDSAPKIVTLVDSMKEEYDSILNELQKDKTHSRQIHQVTHNNQPYMKNHKPFFTWKFPPNDTNIAAFLEGKDVVLAADVAADEVENFQHDAIKFSLIGINLQIPGKEADVQGKLDKVLNGFIANMTHQGSSHYVCCDKSYIINHDIQVIETFVNKDDPEAQIGNGQFDQLRNNKAMLSPYTTWRINLVQDTSAKGKPPSFEELRKLLKNKAVEIELVGKGSYIRRGYKADELICNGMKVTEFYQEDATYYKEGKIKPQIVNHINDLLEKEKTTNKQRIAQEPTEKSFYGSLISEAAKYVNPKNWFFVNENNSHGLNNDAFSETPKLANANEQSVANITDLNLQSSLLLMGLLVPKPKVKSRKISQLDIINDNLAHDLAYSAHVPANEEEETQRILI